MEKQFNGYTAIQTAEGYHVVFHDSSRTPIDVKFNDFQELANKYSQEILAGKIPKLSDDEAVLLSLWELVLIPANTIH